MGKSEKMERIEKVERVNKPEGNNTKRINETETADKMKTNDLINNKNKIKRARAIMVQGTMSNAGKSFLVAGLCRVFAQDGYKAAPFKSQNMALNSYITEDGLEMGRAQVMQAEAAGIEPHVNMNPILLKPTTDVGSQVILNGRVVGNMKAVEYFKKKRDFIPDIMRAYRQLEEEYDIIVIEGAGSPAEINLKACDIVNMGLAELVDAPVILVGDIDRGGVFAQLVGTLVLLEEKERERVKGFVINKFRGDKTILKPGLDMLYERSQVDTLGVIPYEYVDIDDEDSLSERFERDGGYAPVEIGIIKLPRISNFTDFAPLECMDGVRVYYVEKVSQLKNPDMVILPGTKNTMSDLKWLREHGLEAAIKKLASSGKVIMGICGGYQMLGRTLQDIYGVEGEAGRVMDGMGLLPMDTRFTEKKVRTRVRGKIGELSSILEGWNHTPIFGYEIHMGISEGDALQPFSCVEAEDNQFLDGGCFENIVGTYIHGIWESDEFRQALVKLLYEKKGISYGYGTEDMVTYEEYKEMQYNKLADLVRNNMNMEKIYDIINGKG